ncbi:MAG TPA: hypothetical protein VLM78_10625 [Anaerolineales bacterium]|nr:hypothetical protein [Anaerolineales bacterium]
MRRGRSKFMLSEALLRVRKECRETKTLALSVTCPGGRRQGVEVLALSVLEALALSMIEASRSQPSGRGNMSRRWKNILPIGLTSRNYFTATKL